MRRLLLIAAAAVALSLGGVGIWAGAVPANAVVAAESDEVVSVAVGSTGFDTSTITVPILGTPRVVPGDSRAERISVRNDSSIGGQLTATIVYVTLAGDVDDPFYADRTVNGYPVVDLVGGDVALLSQNLAAGASVPLEYAFPVDAVSGNDSAGALEARFAVKFTMTAETDASLADTGFAPEPLIVGALLLLLGGAVLLRRRAGVGKRPHSLTPR